VANGRELEIFGGSLTGGPQGISAIDRIDLPLVERFGALDLRPWYWSALALVALMLFVNVRLRDSRVGRAWIALRDDEGAAANAGVPIVRTKLLAYGVGAAAGGVSGAFLASYLSTVNPNQFTFSFSIFILAMVVLGGLGSIWGVVAGAIVLSMLNTHLLPEVLSDVPRSAGLDFDLSQASSGIYGFLLVIVMLLRPEGLLPERRHPGGQAASVGMPSPPSGFGPPMAISSSPSEPASKARTTGGATRMTSHARMSRTSSSRRTRHDPATTT
jgi:branched-chain amino acid transport system permease protein